MADPPFAMALLGQQDRSTFDCGNMVLNGYLRTQAGQDMKRKVAACFLAIATETGAIAGFYTLSAAHVHLTDVAAEWQARLPRYPTVPAARLGRLAIDLRYQGQKLGAAMLANAVARSLQSDLAAHMMVVEAKTDAAAAFYRHHGFRADPVDPLRLFAPLATLRRALALE